MNLFILDRDPIIAASYYCDRHVCKIILEAKTLLDHAHNIKGPYYHNPVSRWVREYEDNYLWTCKHATALCHEYTKRYYKKHAFQNIIFDYFFKVPPWIDKGSSDFYQAVAEDCVNLDDPVEAYRRYYKEYKRDICKWKLGNVPEWYK